MGILTISTFNSVVYFALNYTQVINAVLMLAAIPPVIIIFKEKFQLFHFVGATFIISGIYLSNKKTQ